MALTNVIHSHYNLVNLSVYGMFLHNQLSWYT